MPINQHYDEISHCNKCGFCQTACPIFRSTGHESGVARGRLALIRALIEKRLDWNRDLEEPLFDCLLCGACTAHCFPAIPTSDLIIDARCEYQQEVGRKQIHRLLFEHLLPYPRRLHAAAHAAAVGKASGLSKIVAALGLLRFLGRDFHRAEEIIDRIPRRSFRTKVRPGKYQGRAESMRIGFFVGCGADIMQQTATRASFELLRAFGRTIHVFDNCCCGLPAWSYGDMEAAQNLAEKNLSLIMADDVDLIVTDCSSCASFLKKYTRLFPPGDAHHEYASVMGTKIKDIVELATPASNDEILGEEPLRVTYHDPCHASRGQHLVAQPRKILQGIPGVRYIELPEADWCCGGAGSYAFSHYELSRKVLDRKIENIEQTGAQVVATSCPACMIHLAYGIRKHGLPIQVKHISEIITGPRS